MSNDRDDDALHWDGDDDPTLESKPARTQPEAAPAAPVALPDGFTAVGRGADTVGHIEDDGTVVMPTEHKPLSSAALVSLGVIAGAYLLFVIGWIVGGLRLQGTAQFLVSQVGYTVALWLAVAAPVLWFGAVILLTRTSKPWIRIVWLVAGLVVLIPWPFVLVGVVGQ